MQSFVFQHAVQRLVHLSGGISERNPVSPEGKWARGLTSHTAKLPPAIYNLLGLVFLFVFIFCCSFVTVFFNYSVINGNF